MRELGTLSIEAALQLGGTHLAAGQSHSFKDPLKPEFRFLIRLLPRTSPIIYLFVISIRVFLHKVRVSSTGCGGSSRDRLRMCLSASLQQDNEE
jgi:hypothetical protein